MKRTLAGIAVAATLAGAVPVLPEEMKWRVSYETIQFETADGDIALNEYAVANGGWYIRTMPKDEGGFSFTDVAMAIDGKKEVTIRCEKCAYYDEFIDDKRTYRAPNNQTEYNKLRYVKDAPQPKKAKFISTYEAIFAPAATAEAAIAFDATTTASATELSASSASWTHPSTGTNLALGVGVQIGIATSGSAVLSVTYNSVALTQADANFSDSAVDRHTAAWYLAAPTTGSNTVVVTINATQTFNAHAITLTGVAQTGTLDAVSTVNNTPINSPVIATTTTVASDAWIWNVAMGRTLTVHTDQTQRLNIVSGTRSYNAGTRIATTPGDYSTTWVTGIANAGIVAISFAPFIEAVVSYPPPQINIQNGSLRINNGALIIK